METTNLAPKMYPDLKQSFGLLGIFMLVQLVVSIVFLFLSMLLFDSYNPSILIFISYILSFILTLWFGIYKRKLPPNEAKFYFNKIPNEAYLILILVTLAILILVDPLVSLIPMPDTLKQMLEEMMSSQSPLMIILIVIGAPILEEMLFRGIILDGFLHHYSPQKAIVWSSILFGLVHFNPWQFMAASIGGLFIGWVYWQTRSLLPAMFIHFVMNFSSFFLGSILIGEDQMFITFDSIGGFWAFLLLMVISITVLRFGLPIVKQIFSPINKTHEFTDFKQKEDFAQEVETEEETEDERRARKRKGCLRILFIGVGIALLSIMICTVGVKMLLKDSLSEAVKQEVIQITQQDEQLKDKFIISNVSGNQMYLKLDLEFLQKPESIGDVKKWMRYVCEQSEEVLKTENMSIGSINVTGLEIIPEKGKYIFGVMSYNGFSHAYNFFEMNEVR